MPIDRDKALGALLGMAVGESLGGRDLGPATSMAFRLADSLIAQRGFDPEDVLRSYVAWFGTGPDGIDRATASVLQTVAAGADAYDATSRHAAGIATGGNGTAPLTRSTPIALAFARHPEGLRDATLADAALTDFDPLPGKAALLHNQSVALLIARGRHAFRRSLVDPLPFDDRLQDVVLPAIGGSRRLAEELAPREPGAVTTPIAVAFAAYFTSDSFDGALEWATGLGGDAAANGALAGALLGARFGAAQIPAPWVEQTGARAQIERLHAGLLQLAG